MSKTLSEILRPCSFDDLVIADDLKSKLIKMRDKQNVMNMLFYGKPGSGKTSAANIFVKSDIFDQITLNGSLDTSVEDVRNRILNFTTTCSLLCKPKIVFIDEADYLSKNAQASLRKIIEDSSERCRFIFAANELHKIQPAIRSRLLVVSFDMHESQIRKSLDAYKTRVLNVLTEMCSEIDATRVEQIIDMYFPDYRMIANRIEFDLSDMFL